jgi:hypothetical protein
MKIAEEAEQGVRSKESGAKSSKLQANRSKLIRALICCYLVFVEKKRRTGGSRPARRHPFCPSGHKKDAKKALLLAEGISFARLYAFKMWQK